MENKVIRAIKSRVSTRNYTDKKVPLKKLEQILEAGKSAPSGMNRQICSILAIRKKSYIEAFRKIGLEVRGRDCYYNASTLILVYGPRDDRFTIQDATCILENMFIASEALGLGSCWINQSDELLNTPNGLKLRKKLGLKESDYVVGTCIVGYINGEKPQPKPRREDLVRII